MGKLGSSKQHLPFYIAALLQLYIADHHFQQMVRIHFPEEKQIQFTLKKDNILPITMCQCLTST